MHLFDNTLLHKRELTVNLKSNPAVIADELKLRQFIHAMIDLVKTDTKIVPSVSGSVLRIRSVCCGLQAMYTVCMSSRSCNTEH